MKARDGGFLISQIKQLSDRIFDKKLKQYNIIDLNSGQGRILYTLCKHDNITIKELANRTSLGKTTLTSMLYRLQNSNHIVKTVSKEDKRKTLISLTPKSKNLFQSFEQGSLEMISLFYDGLSDSQIDQFEVTLRHILKNLKKYEEKSKK